LLIKSLRANRWKPWFELVDSLITRVLGEPKVDAPKNLDGYSQWTYQGKVTGMHIQMVGKKAEISSRLARKNETP
jgi:hypothetical protein